MTRQTALLLGLLALGGFLIRVVNTGSGLWYDEIRTFVEYVPASLGSLLTECTDLNNHLLFTLCAKVSVWVFGANPWALRLPAVLFGVACIPATWWFARKLVSEREALLAAVLVTVAYHHVWFSQNARGYTGLTFFNLLATGFFVEGLRRPTRGVWVAYGFCAAAALWTHLTAGFALAAHGLSWLVLALLRRAPLRLPLMGFLVAGCVGAALYAGLVPRLVTEFGRQAGMESQNVKVREWTSPLWTLREALRQTGLSAAVLAAVGAGGLLAATGFASVARRSPAAAAAMVLPAPVGLSIVLLLEFHVWPRYFFPLLPFAFVFFVRGVFAVAETVAAKAAVKVGTAVVAIAAAFAAAMLPATWQLPKQDYAGARDFVETSRRPDDPVVTVGLAADAYAWLYAPSWRRVDDVAALDDVVAAPGRTWIVTSFPMVLRTSHPRVAARIEESLDRVAEFRGTVGDGTVVVWRER